MRDYLEYYIVKFFLLLTKLLPISLVYKLFNALAILLFKLIKSRRKIAIKNLTNAYPDKSNEDIQQIALDNFKSLGITISEILLILTNRLDIEEKIINKKEILQKLASYSKDKGIIFTTAHFGNWEILAHFLAKNGYPMSAIGRKGNNTLIEDRLTTPFREKYGNINIHKSQAMSQMVRTLRGKRNVGLLIDQKAGNINSTKANFFGRATNTTISVASMKLKYNPFVIPMFLRRKNDGFYEIIMYDSIEYMGEDQENKEDKIQAMTQKYNDIFEEVVRSAPEQWFWMHNRWKI